MFKTYATTHSFTPWTAAEILARFPERLVGMEGEGDGGQGGGSGTTPPTPPAGDAGTGFPNPTPNPNPEPDVFPRDYVETLRTENASRRTREKELEAELQKFKDQEAERAKAEMSDVERANTEKAEAEARAAAAEASLLTERKRNAIISEASKLRFRDPEDALAYIDLEAISMTESGQPHATSIVAAVKKVADEKKYLIDGSGSADGGARGNAPTPADKAKEIQDDITSRGGVRVTV